MKQAKTAVWQIALRRGPWTWRARPELADRIADLERAALHPERRPGARTVKETGGRRTIWRLPFAEGGSAEIFVKHYSRPRFSKQLKHLVRNSRTRQEWEMGRRLEALGLPVARHLAMAERRLAGLLQEDYLVQEALVNHRNFDAWFREEWGSVRSGPKVKGRREAVERLADLIRRMHDLGVLQRDFKPDSIMVSPSGDYRLVDLERALIKRGRRGLSGRDRIANLAKIDQTFGRIGTMSDRLRFLRRYYHDRKLSPRRLSTLIQDISRRAELEWREKARDVRVWAATENESYHQYEEGGFRISAYLTLHRPFIVETVENIRQGRAAGRGHLCSWPPAGPNFKMTARWGDAMTALEHTASLYYRKPPFVPARAAFRPGPGQWGLLLSTQPDPVLPTWVEAAARAREQGRAAEFAAELGRALRIFHRMGMVFSVYEPDAMLYDPDHPDPLHRFYLNRLDRLILDHTPGERETRERLDAIGTLLELDPDAARAMEQAYRRSLLRWFMGRDRW